MDLIRNLWTSFFSEIRSPKKDTTQSLDQDSKKVENSVQDNTSEPKSEPEQQKQTSVPSSIDEEINILAREFGCLQRGQTYQIHLHRILELCPRNRKKADAYKGLRSELMKRHGVGLEITSKTTKNDGTL